MAREVDDEATDSHLSTEMRSRHTEPVTQVPPQFALCLCRHTPHLLRELTLRCCPGAITLGPYSRLIRCPNLHALPHDPHPRPLPTRGRGAVRDCCARSGPLTHPFTSA